MTKESRKTDRVCTEEEAMELIFSPSAISFETTTPEVHISEVIQNVKHIMDQYSVKEICDNLTKQGVSLEALIRKLNSKLKTYTPSSETSNFISSTVIAQDLIDLSKGNAALFSTLIRKHYNFTQKELATELHFTLDTIKDIESGKLSMPKILDNFYKTAIGYIILNPNFNDMHELEKFLDKTNKKRSPAKGKNKPKK